MESERTINRTESTEQSPNSSDHQKVFELRFFQLRHEFEERRAQNAVEELTKNRLCVRQLLEPCQKLISQDVCIDFSFYTHRDEGSGVKLSPGKIVSIKSDKHLSKQPRFREAYQIPEARRIPNYTNWSFINDNQQQRKVPTKKKLFYTDEAGEALPASDDDSESAPATYHLWFGKDVEWREFCLTSMEPEFNCLRNFPKLLSNSLCVDLHAVEARLEEKKSLLQNGSVEETTRLLCRRCLRYNCLRHPSSSVVPNFQPKESVPDSIGGVCGEDCCKVARKSASEFGRRVVEGVSESGVEVRRRSDTQMDGSKSTELSEGLPWTTVGVTPSSDHDDPDGWTLDEILLLEKGLDIYRDNPCLLARFVWTKSCRQVSNYLSRYHGAASRGMSTMRKRRKLPKKTLINRKGAPVVAKRLHHSESELWHQYLPCSCKNGCSVGCPCVKSKNFCDKYCACWTGPKTLRKVCSNVWKGCKCAQRCDTQRCPCVAASRECDPDICGSCRDTFDPDCPEEFACKNMNIRLGRRKRVAMGISEITGWGTFMLEDAKKDDLVGEYVGELISDDEAERRGQIYDMEDKSYLFSATAETVIDANHRGNKLRFANHSAEPNCYVKYLLVDGDYRVGIFAGRDISGGEELLYDYGTSFLSNWNDEAENTSLFPSKTAGRRL